MTTTQPPLTPGQHILIEAYVNDEGWLEMARKEVRISFNGDRTSLAVSPTSVRWRPMPAEDSPDAAHVARLEAELASAKAAYEGEAKAYLFMEQVTIRLGAEIERLLAERDALRKVYDAAKAWRVLDLMADVSEDSCTDALIRLAADVDAHPERPVPDDLGSFLAEQMQDPEFAAAYRAVEERHRAGQKAPADAPAPRQDDEPAADDHGQTTEAQKGARAESWSWHLVSERTMVGDVPRHWGVCETCGYSSPANADPGAAGAHMELHRFAHNRLRVAKPTTAQPQPTDAPGRRDWAGEAEAALEHSMEPSGAIWLSIASPRTIAGHLVDALGLPVLEDERDDLRERAEHYQRERDEARARLSEETITLQAVVNQRDEAAGKLDALRAELRDAVRRMTASLIAVSDRLDKPYTDAPELTPWTRFIKPRLTELRLLAGLDAAPPMTTPDGTGTATDGSEGGGRG